MKSTWQQLNKGLKVSRFVYIKSKSKRFGFKLKLVKVRQNTRYAWVQAVDSLNKSSSKHEFMKKHLNIFTSNKDDKFFK